MNEELKRYLAFIWGAIAIGCVLILTVSFISYLGLLPSGNTFVSFLPMVFLVIVMVIVVPKANRYWALRDEYKDHVARYNISKDDMNALKNGDV